MSTHTPGMVELTKEQFYAAVGPRNIHPRPFREHTEWIDLNTHAVVGVSTPGYANTYGPDGRLSPVTYKAVAAIAKATGEAA